MKKWILVVPIFGVFYALYLSIKNGLLIEFNLPCYIRSLVCVFQSFCFVLLILFLLWL